MGEAFFDCLARPFPQRNNDSRTEAFFHGSPPTGSTEVGDEVRMDGG